MLVALLAWSAWQATGLHLETDITRFLPDNEARRQLALSGLVRSTAFSHGMVVAIALPPPPVGDAAPADADAAPEAAADAAVAFGDALADDLRATGLFRSVANGVAPALPRTFFDTYFPRRLAFLSDAPETAIPALFSPDGLAAALSALKDRFLLPSAPLVKQVADADPLMAFADRVQRIRESTGRMAPRIHRDRYFSADLRHHLLMLETHAAAFDTAAQAPAIDALRAAFDARNRAAGNAYALSFTGLNRFVLEGERRAKADIAWASTASTIAVALLFLLFFRRLRFLAMVFLPVAFGVAVALGVVAAVKGSVHGLTLGFGATLIGVCDDYPIHMLTHLRFATHREAQARRSAWKALAAQLSVGLGTTVIGFAFLGFSAYPGIREIALFCITGIAAAFAFTWIALPLAGRLIAPGDALRERGAGRPLTARIRRVLAPRRRAIVAGMVLLAVAAIALLPRMRLETDARALDAADPATLAEDAAVRALLPAAAYPRYLLVSGDTLQQALERNDALDAALARLKADDPALDWVSLHPVLPSAALQRRNLDALAAIPDAPARVRDALVAAGFRPDAFAPFLAALDDARAGRVVPLTPGDLAGTPLEPLAGAFHFAHDGRHWVLTLAGPEGDLDRLSAVLPWADDIVRIQPSALVSSLVTSSQRETLWLLIAGIALNVAVVWAWRRRVRLTVATVAPTLLSLLAVAAGMAALDVPVNFLHMVALLLVASMGLDYAVFLVGAPQDPRGNDAAIGERSILVSALTTAVTYLVLATCQTAALRSVGATVGIGILVVCVLTFLADVAARGDFDDA